MFVYRRDGAAKAYAGVVLCALVLVVAWVLVLPRVPAGWPRIAVNGAGYALSIVVIADSYDQLKRAMRPLHAFLLAAGTWLFIIVLVRWLFVMLLDVL